MAEAKEKKHRYFPARVLLILAGVIAAVLFVPPLFYGVRGLGHITGTVIAAVLLAAGVGFDRLRCAFRKLAGTRRGKVVIGVIAALILLAAVTAAAGTVCMVRGASREPDPQAVLVVLGCKVRGETPSMMLRERLEAALNYLEEHPDAACVVSGGRGSGESISEAECMFRWLTERGIAPERIYREDASTDTWENLEFTQRILEEEELGTRVALCTNEFHEYRAEKIAGSLGLDAGAVPARTSFWLLPGYWVRELYGFLYVLVFN